MLGSKNTYFRQNAYTLEGKWVNIYNLLFAKGYSKAEIGIYEKAYFYFCDNPKEFDGATLVKDLCDIPGLDLDAMLHDYHYIVYNAGANLLSKKQADLIYASGMRRKGKNKYSAYSRLFGLSVIDIPFVVWATIRKGKASKEQKIAMNEEYNNLTQIF